MDTVLQFERIVSGINTVSKKNTIELLSVESGTSCPSETIHCLRNETACFRHSQKVLKHPLDSMNLKKAKVVILHPIALKTIFVRFAEIIILLVLNRYF
jgi:hypothetical protein